MSNAAAEAIDLAAAAGLYLDDWQKWVLTGALGERANGTWSAFECALIVPRQNGKNAILEALELAGLVLFGDDLIVHTAHRADTTLEHFRRMTQYAEEFDDFRQLVTHVSNKNGAEAIELKGNRRVRFVSRARNPGRGYSGSKVILDEAAYGLPPAVIGAMIPTLATRPMAQVWYTSSAPKADSDALHSVRKRGRGIESEKLDDRLFYAEWGNDADVDLDDMDAVARANPGLGIRITEDFARAERRLMLDMPEEYARERMGVADEPKTSAAGPIPLTTWDDLLDAKSTPDPKRCRVALDTNPDRTWFTLCLAGDRADGLVHAEITKSHNNKSDAVELAVSAAEKLGVSVICSEASGLVDAIEQAGGTADPMSTSEQAKATSKLIDATRGVAPVIRHRGEPAMRRALELAQTKPFSDGGIVWSRRTTSGDISPLTALTMAFGRLGSDVDHLPEPFVVFS